MNDVAAVIGLGEALWDVFGPTRHVGGAPANFAWHVAQHGLPACALSALGQDAAGDALAEALEAAGAPCALQRVAYPTGEVRICLDGAGVPQYHILPDAAWDHLSATPEMLAMARRARALCYGSLAQRSELSRAAIAAFLQAMPEGAWRIFDINLRCGYYTHAILRDSLRWADVLKINEEEMEILGRMEGLYGLPQLEQAQHIARRYELRLLILTCGAIGSYVLGEGGKLLSWLPTPAVHVVDTVGAGDSFTATFMAALLCGQSVPQAHAAAVRVAAYVCTQAGAMVKLPPALRLSPAATLGN